MTCEPVGRADVSNTRGPAFESSKFCNEHLLPIHCWKDENKEKEVRNGLFKKGRAQWSVWPEKNCQMSIKVAQNWLQ